MISIWHKKSNTLFYSSPNQTPPPPPYSQCPPPPPPPPPTTTTTTVHLTTVSLSRVPPSPRSRSPSGDTDPPWPLPHAIQAARPLFIMQPLRLLTFHLLLLLATYLLLEPRTALAIVRLLSALQVISVVDGLFRYLSGQIKEGPLSWAFLRTRHAHGPRRGPKIQSRPQGQ
jgi:hypothetical protein